MAADGELAEVARHALGKLRALSKFVAEATDNKFQILPFAAGEIVPALQTLDAVQNGTVEMGHTAYYYYIGKDPTWALFCSTPFGLNARQQNAWLYYGGGLELIREIYDQFGIINFPAANTGAQMGGWYRRPINSVADCEACACASRGSAAR